MLVLATFMPVTLARVEAVETAGTTGAVGTAGAGKDGEDGKYPETNLTQILYIRYPIIFRKKSVLALLDLGNEINAIHPTFAKERGLSIRPTNVGV